MNNKKIYQVVWDIEAFKQLHQLASEKEAKIIQELTNDILAHDPYDNLKYIEKKVNFNKIANKNKQVNIKRLEYDWAGYWRLRYKKYRIVYEILENQIIVDIFKFDNRFNVYNNPPIEDDKDS